MADKKKLAFEYNYIDTVEGEDRIVSIEAGTILSDAQLKVVQKAQPTWVIGEFDAMPEISNGEMVMGEKDALKKGPAKPPVETAVKLTADEKPAAPKDEDPKDPDKKKA